MSLPRFAGWGTLAGFLVAAFLVTAVGVSSPSLFAAGIVTLLCTVSAAGSLALARRAAERASVGAGADVAEAGLSDGEAQQVLGSSD